MSAGVRCALLDALNYRRGVVLQFEPLTKVEKAGMFGTDKYLLQAEISPVALAEVAEEYQIWFAAKAQKVSLSVALCLRLSVCLSLALSLSPPRFDQVSMQQAQLGGDMQMAESNSRIMYQELNDLKKEAAVASARLSTEGRTIGTRWSLRCLSLEYLCSGL